MTTCATLQQQQRSAKAQQPLRVLIYTTCYNVLDGVTLTVRSIEQGILAAGHEVCILTTNSGNPIHTNMNGTHPNRRVIFIDNTVPLPFIHDIDKPESSYCIGFSLSPYVQQQLMEYEPSIIHITITDFTTLHLIQYARQKEIPIIGTYHSHMPHILDHYGYMSCIKPIVNCIFRHQYNFLQAMYAPTLYTRQNLIDDMAVDQVTSLQVWGHGVDIDKFNPAHRSIEYRNHVLGIGALEETPILLWVGRLVREKQIGIFINVVKRLHTKQCKFHALVVGSGAYEDEVKSLPNTTFAGWLTADELSTVYASCDVFLFPSAVETFGLVTLEAVASALPVVVSGGCSGHIVDNGKNGYLCADDDEDAFYDGTRTLLEDMHLRQEFGAYGREMSLSLEKSIIVRQMVDNYSRNIDEFDTKYSGHHSQRDVEYAQSSFLLGTDPRPLALTVIEAAFRLWCNIMYKLTCIIYWYNTRIGNGGGSINNNKTIAPSDQHVVSSSKDTICITKMQSLQSYQIQKDRQDVIDSISRKKYNNKMRQSVIEPNDDAEINSNNHGCQPSLSLSSTNGRSISSSPTKIQARLCHTIITTCAHVIVTTIVVSLQVQGCIESYVRQCVTSLWSGHANSSSESTRVAKRK